MRQSLLARPELGPLILLVAELVAFTAINPQFMSLGNIGNVLTFTVELGLVALPMTLLMTAGEFDLSVGSVFGFSPVLMWTLFNTGEAPMTLAFLVALLAAALVGFVNGWFVTRLRIPSFLVTLGMLLVVRGTALFITDGFPQRTWNAGGHWLAEILVGDFTIGSFRPCTTKSGRLIFAALLTGETRTRNSRIFGSRSSPYSARRCSRR